MGVAASTVGVAVTGMGVGAGEGVVVLAGGVVGVVAGAGEYKANLARRPGAAVTV